MRSWERMEPEKSTFIKVITGVHQPDSGMMLLEGEKITLRSTEDSAKLGIAAIYQHVTAFPDLSVTENIFMGQEIKNKVGLQLEADDEKGERADRASEQKH